MRLFVAVDIPTEVKGIVQAMPRPELGPLRWTTPGQWHVTVRFLGEVDGLEGVIGALEGVPAALGGTGVGEVHAALGPATAWFAGRRVLHVPVTGLDALAGAVLDATEGLGERPDPRPFSGHLTLARMRGRASGAANLAGVSLKASWLVGEIALLSSALGPGGARYEPLATMPLGL